MTFSPREKIGIREFLRLSETIPVADVRSPSEFSTGHIPGACNIPLFDDNERAIVGTIYRKEGRSKAILRGTELTGPSMHEKLRMALALAGGDNKLLVHCWRGGMRSEAMAWLFSLGDIDTCTLTGGYKSYRHHVLESLAEKRKTVVLGGMTGSSKTLILRKMRESGHQVVDLEALASHKGSAFGALGQPAQPSSEHFANLLFNEWKASDPARPLWLEDESRNIGTVFMPDAFFGHILSSPVIVLRMSIQKRLPRLLDEYSAHPPSLLMESVMKISKRLGGDNTKDALHAIESGDLSKAIEITLNYYDRTYLFGISTRHTGRVIYVETETNDIEANTQKVLEASRQIEF